MSGGGRTGLLLPEIPVNAVDPFVLCSVQSGHGFPLAVLDYEGHAGRGPHHSRTAKLTHSAHLPHPGHHLLSHRIPLFGFLFLCFALAGDEKVGEAGPHSPVLAGIGRISWTQVRSQTPLLKLISILDLEEMEFFLGHVFGHLSQR